MNDGEENIIEWKLLTMTKDCIFGSFQSNLISPSFVTLIHAFLISIFLNTNSIQTASF